MSLISFDNNVNSVDGHRPLISFHNSMSSIECHRPLISFLYCKGAVKAEVKVESDQRPAMYSRKTEPAGRNRKRIGHIDREIVSYFYCSTKESWGYLLHCMNIAICLSSARFWHSTSIIAEEWPKRQCCTCKISGPEEQDVSGEESGSGNGIDTAAPMSGGLFVGEVTTRTNFHHDPGFYLRQKPSISAFIHAARRPILDRSTRRTTGLFGLNLWRQRPCIIPGSLSRHSDGEQINNTVTGHAVAGQCGRRWSVDGRQAEPAQLALTVRLRSATLHLPLLLPQPPATATAAAAAGAAAAPPPLLTSRLRKLSPCSFSTMVGPDDLAASVSHFPGDAKVLPNTFGLKVEKAL